MGPILGTGEYMANGLEQGAATAAGAVDALHSVTVVQVICVAAGVAVCLLLPRIYEKRK